MRSLAILCSLFLMTPVSWIWVEAVPTPVAGVRDGGGTTLCRHPTTLLYAPGL